MSPSFVYKGLCDATREERKSCVIDEHRDRQTGADYIGPTIHPRGSTHHFFKRGGGGGSEDILGFVTPENLDTLVIFWGFAYHAYHSYHSHDILGIDVQKKDRYFGVLICIEVIFWGCLIGWWWYLGVLHFFPKLSPPTKKVVSWPPGHPTGRVQQGYWLFQLPRVAKNHWSNREYEYIKCSWLAYYGVICEYALRDSLPFPLKQIGPDKRVKNPGYD